MSTAAMLPGEAPKEVLDALEAVILFYEVEWTPERQKRWQDITGSHISTTKALCDHVRIVLDRHGRKP